MARTGKAADPAGEEFRDLRRKPPLPAPPPPKGRQLIAVIGIDDYAHWPKLSNAVNDASGVLDLFERELFFERASEPLLNEAASREGITDLVFNELSKRLEENDSLILFFAGHGHSETRSIGKRKVESGYLIPWDAQVGKRNDWINVDELLSELSLLPSRHLLFIIDACHSGIAVGQQVRQFRSGTVRYTDELSSLPSRKIITSARRHELALDGGPVPGHSLFTSLLIHGLRSAEADTDDNDFVSGRELGLYLQQKVAQAAWEKNKQSKQTPDFGEFGLDDRGDIVISLKREQVESNLAAGRCMRILGERLNDRGRLESAMRYLDTAIRLSPAPNADALLERGRTHFAATRYDLAIVDLAAVRKLNPNSAEALFYLGLGEALQDHAAPAAEALREFLVKAPADPRREWVLQLTEYLESPRPGVFRALLIGVGRYAHGSFYHLLGPPNDVALIRRLFLETGRFEADNVTTLVDDEASRAGILDAFERLVEKVTPDDAVFIHFSGHATSADEPGYLAPHDAAYESPPPGLGNGPQYTRLITEEELDDFLTRLRAINRVLILDTHVTHRLDTLASRQSAYTVVMATTPRVWAREMPVADAGGNPMTVYGAFSYALATALEEAPEEPLGTIMQAVAQQVKALVADDPNPQIPAFYGLADRSFWAQRRPANQPLLQDLDLAGLRRYDAVSDERLQRVEQPMRNGQGALLPDVRTSLGTALVNRGRFKRAAAVLEAANTLSLEAACMLATALVRTGRYEESASLLRGQQSADPESASRLEPVIEIVDTLRTSQAHALLVGVESPTIAVGTATDVETMRAALLETGLGDENIRVLTNNKATVAAIRAAFEELAVKAKDAPALFYFAGPGTLIDKRTPGVVGAQTLAVPLDWFKSAVGDDPTNLITIFDAGWKEADLPWGPAPGSRFSLVWTTPRDIGPSGIGGLGSGTQPGAPDDGQEREAIHALLAETRIGRASIFHVSIRHSTRRAVRELAGESIVESDFYSDKAKRPTRRGVLTTALVDVLRSSQGMRLIRLREVEGELARRMEWLQPFVLCDNADQPVLANTVKEGQVSESLHRLAANLPVEAAIVALTALRRDSRTEDPRVHLDLAVSYAALGEYAQSIEALETARKLAALDDPDIDYETGRVLFESEHDFDAAVSSLHRAVAAAPHKPEAHYYLGAAIRARVERQSEELGRAEEAFARYLELGAPLGHARDIETFLAQRRSVPQ
jgi:tetratricopeptide (TPR) repeat protein